MQVNELVIDTNKMGGGTVHAGGEEDGMEMNKMNGIWGGNFLTQASKKTCRPKVKAEVTIPQICQRMERKGGQKLLRITHKFAQASPVQLLVNKLRCQGKAPCSLVRLLGS